jgi:hypothetical protein
MSVLFHSGTEGSNPLSSSGESRANLTFDPWSHYLPLIESILAQSERRVLEGLAVPASEKLVSRFEPHAERGSPVKREYRANPRLP